MKTRFQPLLILATLSIGACAAPGASLDTPQSTPSGIAGNEVRVDLPAPAIIEFPYHSADLVWRVIPAVFAELRLPAQVMDARNMVYGSQRVTVGSIGGEPTRSHFRCSTDGSAASGATALRIQFGITAQPKAIGPTKTELIVQIIGHGSPIEASRTGNINCISNGRLEGRLKQAIEAELRKT
ncbi:MAG TPA: hypothetical protein VK928_12650 [Longimicrobiales bacterium]|nr:hypothetical protein [Longimicrobiales bacterium]